MELTDDCCLDVQDERAASLVVHHGNQIFTCAECGKAASRKGDLLRHIVREVLIQLSKKLPLESQTLQKSRIQKGEGWRVGDP